MKRLRSVRRASRTWSIQRLIAVVTLVVAGTSGAVAATFAGTAASATPRGLFFNSKGVTSSTNYGNLDCNGFSPLQKGHQHTPYACTDIRGFAGIDNPNAWGGRFYDNGKYIG